MAGHGKKFHIGTYMEPAVEYRRLTNQDVSTPLIIDAIPEYVDMRERELSIFSRLDFQVIVPDSVTQFDIEAFGDISTDLTVTGIDNGGANRWSRVDGMLAQERSTFMTILDCPMGRIKLLITNVVGSFAGGPIIILSSKSQ